MCSNNANHCTTVPPSYKYNMWKGQSHNVSMTKCNLASMQSGTITVSASLHSMCLYCDSHVTTDKHSGCWVYSLQTPPVCCRRPCVCIWQGGPKFMWRGTGVDTHHYSKAPGSRMNITHSPHPASLTDGLLACQREGLSCFSSLIGSGGSPSIKSDRLSTPVNPAHEQFRKAGGQFQLEKLTKHSFTWMQKDMSSPVRRRQRLAEEGTTFGLAK